MLTVFLLSLLTGWAAAFVAHTPQQSDQCTNYLPTANNTDLSGTAITAKAAADASMCCGICDATANCQGWVWTAGVCYLKGDVKGTYSNPGRFTGIKKQPADCGPFGAELKDTDLAGPMLKQVWASGDENCCSECTSLKGCQGFTYFDHICYLKTNLSFTMPNAGRRTRCVGKCPGQHLDTGMPRESVETQSDLSIFVTLHNKLPTTIVWYDNAHRSGEAAKHPKSSLAPGASMVVQIPGTKSSPQGTIRLKVNNTKAGDPEHLITFFYNYPASDPRATVNTSPQSYATIKMTSDNLDQHPAKCSFDIAAVSLLVEGTAGGCPCYYNGSMHDCNPSPFPGDNRCVCGPKSSDWKSPTQCKSPPPAVVTFGVTDVHYSAPPSWLNSLVSFFK